MRKVFFAFSSLFLLNFLPSANMVVAQSIPVGSPVLEEYYRRAQLVGKMDSTISFTIRPVYVNKASEASDIFDPEQTLAKKHFFYSGRRSFDKGRGVFQILPLTWQQQINSKIPYGRNDGAMIPAKGYQTMLSGGVYFKYGPLSIQLKPEYIYAANPPFEGYAADGSDERLRIYYDHYGNFIDAPERFGNKPYNKLFWGQSKISLTFDPIALSLSNENIWWGPGINNSIILSNNAPGFKHLSLNTVRPIKTYIGTFETQIIAARVYSSGYSPLEVTSLSDGTDLLNAKESGSRYFTGININYGPKWLSGLTMGFTRTFIAYSKDIKTFQDYVPFFIPFEKVNSGIDGDPIPRDQYTSVYARWLFKKAQAEVYFDIGFNDNAYDFRDFTGSPEHSRAYTIGMRKIVSINRANQYLLLGGEITTTSRNLPDRTIREGTEWYLHNGIFHGYTNLGQIMGAGVGSGGNIQSFSADWVHGLKKVGIEFERYEPLNDLNAYFAEIDGNSRKWVNLALALNGTLDYKNFLFNAKIQGIKSLNYQWILEDYDPSKYYIPNNDVFNLHAELGVTFRF